MKTVVGIGAGYVGGPTMAMFADKCKKDQFIVVDINKSRIEAWQSGEPPIYEPGLKELVNRSLGKNLSFSTDIASAIKKADIIFVSVNTPTKTFGAGAGSAADLQYWEKTAREILKNSDSNKIIVEKSTVPVQTAEAMEKILNSNDRGLHFDVLSNPEFLAEGTAVNDLERPSRVLIGGRPTESGLKAVDDLAELYGNWVPEEKILKTNVWSSELSKLAANAFLAQRISSINSLTEFCEATGANITEVSRSIGMDQRIGKFFLNPSVGFGGSCFKKDILNLVYLCRSCGLARIADYWEQVVSMNEYQRDRFVRRMLNAMFNTVADKKIAVFGFAFKADTGDTRESSAIKICNELLAEQAHVAVTDPKAINNAKLDMQGAGNRLSFTDDPYDAANGAHAIAIMTDWQCYAELDYEKIYKSMEKPAFLFDGRNMLDHQKMYEIGFNVYPLGRQPLTHI